MSGMAYIDGAGDVFAQLDGVGDMVHNFPVAGLNHTRHTSAPSGTASVRREQFKLNEKKQLSKLRQDANICDFNITVSPTEQSISIICSTGFYTLVAVPVLSSITVGSKHQIAGVTLFCNDITGKVDDVGSTVNAVVHLRYSSPDQSSNGSIVVHCHHTVRKIQIQGSSMVNRRVRANVWFVENFLLDKFTTISQTKAFDISKFNTAVMKMVTNHIEKMNVKEKCEACLGLFNGRSIHEQCTVCLKSFHKKCNNDHVCTAKTNQFPKNRYPQVMNLSTSHATLAQPPSTSSPMPSTTSYAAVPATTSVANPFTVPAITNDQPPITVSPPSTLPTTAQAVSTAAPGPSVPDLNRILNIDTDPAPLSSSSTTNLDPNSLPFLPAAAPSSEKGKGKGKNKTKPAIATSKEGIDVEFAQIELNTVRTKLKDREKEVKDLEFQNAILLERLAVLEKSEKQKIYDRYFPKPADSTSNPSNCPDPTPAQAPCHAPAPCCHMRQHCWQSQYTCQVQPQHQSSVSSDALESIAKTIQELQKDIAMMKSRLPITPVVHHSVDVSPRRKADKVASQDISAMSDDDSIVTVDENVPDIPSKESLNSFVQTTQLHQLRHQSSSTFLL